MKFDVMKLINGTRRYDKDVEFDTLSELLFYYSKQDIQLLSVNQQIYTNPKTVDQLSIASKKQATILISNGIRLKLLSVRCVKPSVTFDKISSLAQSSFYLDKKEINVKKIDFSS